MFNSCVIQAFARIKQEGSITGDFAIGDSSCSRFLGPGCAPMLLKKIMTCIMFAVKTTWQKEQKKCNNYQYITDIINLHFLSNKGCFVH
jgi:hypothetical protein